MSGQVSMKFHYATQNVMQLKLITIIYFWNFLLNIFKLGLIMGNWSTKKQNYV
jgi:hypothetical protein